jgi:hypothetical protein
MEESGQSNAPATLFSGKEPALRLDMRLCGAQDQAECYAKETHL